MSFRKGFRKMPDQQKILDYLALELKVGRAPALFLDFDGTLAPLARTPYEAVFPEENRRAVERLLPCCPLAISGRSLESVRAAAGIPGISYAGSHGFELALPDGRVHQVGAEFLPRLDRAEVELRELAEGIADTWVERKPFSLALHYRDGAAREPVRLEALMERVRVGNGPLKLVHGKLILELQPALDWHKGRAVEWLLGALGLERPELLPLYLGDDTSDEDAFRAVAGRGLGVLVAEEPRPSAAAFRLRDTVQVRAMLEGLARLLSSV